MPPPTANEIKAQIKALLTPVIGTAATKKAKIIDYFVWAFRPGDNTDPTNLRSELDPVTLIEGGGVIDRVNCLMITEDNFTQELPPSESTLIDDRPRGRNVITRRFRLTYFYQVSEMSELTFSENVELVRTTLNANPKLGFPLIVDMKAGPAQFIKDHSGLQVPTEMLPEPFGKVLVHEMDGLLTVRVIEPLGT